MRVCGFAASRKLAFVLFDGVERHGAQIIDARLKRRILFDAFRIHCKISIPPWGRKFNLNIQAVAAVAASQAVSANKAAAKQGMAKICEVRFPMGMSLAAVLR